MSPYLYILLSLLYDYLKDRGIGYNKCGKLLIACNRDDEIKLKQLHQKAVLNGVANLIELSSIDVGKLEPEIFCTKALLSPDTGIFDSHQYQSSLQVDAESDGANYVFNCEVISVKYKESATRSSGCRDGNSGSINHRFTVETSKGDIEFDYIINAAGLFAIQIANRITNANTTALTSSSSHSILTWFIIIMSSMSR